MRVALAAFLLVGAATTVAHAHPGGTDSYGCHRDSSTGTRHCHNGDEGEGVNWIPAAQAGVDISMHVEPKRLVGIIVGAFVQQDGSVFILAGAEAAPRLSTARGSFYLDAAMGVAMIGGDTLFTFRVTAGLLIPFFQRTVSGGLKIGIVFQGIADGANAEPRGISATYSTAF